MKAYKAWDARSYEEGTTVVFAENAKEAKRIASFSEQLQDADWIDIRVNRFPKMDKHYRGIDEIDWNNADDRKALVELGWTCIETSYECEYCVCKSICSRYCDD